VAPNVFCLKVFSQSEPTDKGLQQPSGDAVDSAKAGEEATEDEAKQGQEEVGADSNTKSEEILDRERTTGSQRKATDLRELRQARDDERPPQRRRPNDDAETYTYSIVPTSPRPPSGNGFIIPGSIALGTGAVGVGTAIAGLTVLQDDSDNENSKADTMLVIGLISSSILVAIGIPMLIIGLNRRSEVVEWKKKNPGFTGLDFRFNQQEAVASWETAF